MSSSVFKLKSVQSIEISNCSIFKRFTEIPSCNRDGGIGIERLPSCKLVLEKCPLLRSLPRSLCVFKSLSLTSLEIIDCQNFWELPDELGYLKALETLIVDGTAMRGVPESLGQLSSLKHLVLSGNNLKRIPESLNHLSSLKHLVLSGNNLMFIPESLSQLSSLEYLVLSRNDFRIKPESRGQLSSLEHLVPYGNDLTRIPESLGQLSSLKHLVLSGNNLKRIPESLSQLSSLEYLQLSGNSLEGIPEYLRSLSSKLTSLNLSVDLKNCLKLDPNELRKIVKDGWMKQSFDGNIGIAKSTYFPGNEIPKWFRYQSMGSSVTLKTAPADFLNNKILVGFVFCIVVAFRASDHFEHQIRKKSRPSVLGNIKCSVIGNTNIKEISTVGLWGELVMLSQITCFWDLIYWVLRI